MTTLWRALPWFVSLSLSISLWGCSAFSPSVPTSAEPAMPDLTPPAEEPLSTPIKPTSSLGQHLPITAYTMLNGTQINLEVAKTPREQAIGLMFRSSLADDQGMLFPFSPSRPVSFWMRNVEIDLDMVFIQDNQVVAIAPQVPPCRTDTCPTYGPSGVPVDAVLELRAGRAAELGLQVGDPITVTFLEMSAESQASESSVPDQ